MYTINFVLLRS